MCFTHGVVRGVTPWFLVTASPLPLLAWTVLIHLAYSQIVDPFLLGLEVIYRYEVMLKLFES